MIVNAARPVHAPVMRRPLALFPRGSAELLNERVVGSASASSCPGEVHDREDRAAQGLGVEPALQIYVP